MEISYKLRDQDGKQYGPVELAQLLDWFKQGRVVEYTQILRSDLGDWRPANTFEELGYGLASEPAAAPAAPPVIPRTKRNIPRHTGTAAKGARGKPDAETRIRRGASWFYWIAGLTVINAVMARTGSESGFVLGLLLTQGLDYAAKDMGTGAKAAIILVDLLAIGGFVTFGLFANKKHVWAFIVGMSLYAIDAVLALIAQVWLGVGIHVWAMISLAIGLRACLEFNRRARAAADSDRSEAWASPPVGPAA